MPKKANGTTRVLLLEEEDDGLTIGVLRCLQLAGGYQVHCLSGSPDTVLRRSRHCRVEHVSWGGPAGMVAAIAEYTERQPVDLIIPIHEAMIVMAGQAADEIGQLAPLAPGPGPALCERVDNKWSFHRMMTEAGVPVPRATVASDDPEALLRELEGWGSAVMLKPPAKNGGKGIRKFARPGDLLEALDRAPARVRARTVIQEFVPGADIDCSFLSLDGEIIAYTVQRAVFHQATAFSPGLGLEFVQHEAVAEVAARFAKVSRWSGVAHLDMRLDSRTGEPVLIEVNPRYWTTLLGSLAMGVNFPDLHCRVARGDSPIRPASRTGYWLDAHSLMRSARNPVELMRRDPRFLRYVQWRVLAADPRVEITLVYRTLRRVMTKVAAGAARMALGLLVRARQPQSG